jgi:DNA-binding beta-propeller fold protein YncE
MGLDKDLKKVRGHVIPSNTGNGTISEIDTATWIVRRNMIASSSPEHIVLSPDGRTLYVADNDLGTVSVLSLDQGRVVKTYAIGGEIHGIDLSDDARTLFVSGKGEDKLVAVDLATDETRTRPLGPAPYHLAVVRGAGKLYVSSQDEPKIWVVSERSLEPLGVIQIRGEGHQMAVIR